MKTIEWKSKRSDILIVIACLILFIIGSHILLALRGGKHDRTDSINTFFEHLTDTWRFLTACAITLLAYSPFYAFRIKVPKKITLDLFQNLLIIQRRYKKKNQLLTLEGLGYYYYEESFFSVLEIYQTFQTSRGGIRKRYRTIIVPFWGMAD